MATVRIPAPKSVQIPEIRLPLNFLSGGGIRPAVAGLAEGAEAGGTTDSGGAQQQETIGVSTQSENADGVMVFVAYVLVGFGLWIGNMLAAKGSAITFSPLDGLGMLALFFIMAQALERLMEPISELNIPKLKFGSSKNGAEASRDTHIRNALSATSPDAASVENRQAEANNAANAEAETKKIGANTKVVIWGLATFVAMLISGATHLFFLDAVGAKGVSNLINVLVTGLVIGSGTKPLHELVKMLEKKNEEPEDGSGANGDNV